MADERADGMDGESEGARRTKVEIEVRQVELKAAGMGEGQREDGGGERTRGVGRRRWGVRAEIGVPGGEQDVEWWGQKRDERGEGLTDVQQ